MHTKNVILPGYNLINSCFISLLLNLINLYFKIKFQGKTVKYSRRKWKVFSSVQLFVFPWTVSHQAPLSMEFSRQNTGVSAIPFSRGSSWPRDRIWVSCIIGRFFTIWVTREASNRNTPNFWMVRNLKYQHSNGEMKHHQQQWCYWLSSFFCSMLKKKKTLPLFTLWSSLFCLSNWPWCLRKYYSIFKSKNFCDIMLKYKWSWDWNREDFERP